MHEKLNSVVASESSGGSKIQPLDVQAPVKKHKWWSPPPSHARTWSSESRDERSVRLIAKIRPT